MRQPLTLFPRVAPRGFAPTDRAMSLQAVARRARMRFVFCLVRFWILAFVPETGVLLCGAEAVVRIWDYG
jgi:hypothetical protein